MARQPKLRKKKVGKSTYWFTKAGGDTYLGNVDDVTHQDARKLFADHLLRLRSEDRASKRRGLAAGELMDLFLEWVQKHRSQQNYTTRKTYCSRFGAFRVGSHKMQMVDLPADKVTGEDLEAWLDTLKKEGLEAQTRLHAETSVRHCWNWATKHPSPIPHLPPTFRPFSSVERTHVPLKPLTEDDLITDQEVQAIFNAAALDPDQFRRHGLTKTAALRGIDRLQRTDGQVGCFSDLLRCYHATGARTDELASCLVEDILFRTRQVVLGKHKRSRTQKCSTLRQVTLNNEALAVFVRHCEGKQSTERVFLNNDGRPWTVRTLAKRFERVKEIAAALKFGAVREQITIYDFRHLWISEMLMAGNDIALVARMAGTSIAMIERVYGHFRNQHLHDAQARLDQLRQQHGR
jgi:site-specific recombinase XerD